MRQNRDDRTGRKLPVLWALPPAPPESAFWLPGTKLTVVDRTGFFDKWTHEVITHTPTSMTTKHLGMDDHEFTFDLVDGKWKYIAWGHGQPRNLTVKIRPATPAEIRKSR